MRGADVLTTFLDVFGLALIVAAAYLFAGVALAVFVAGVACITLSWALTRDGGDST